jgi:type IV pilus assembly protein PilY1
MRKRSTRSLAAAAFLLLVTAPAGKAAAQQLDVNPPKPNVLLLVDNSGSMERMIDGSLPEDNAANACDVTSCNVGPLGTTCTWAASPPASPNRWNILLNTLVGSATNGFHCIAMPRNAGGSSVFAQEYEIGNTLPYDNGYYLPYHRAIAKDTTSNVALTPCTFAPGSLPGAAAGAGVGPNGYGSGGSADTFPANAIVNRPYGQVTVNQTAGHQMTCQYSQNQDGILVGYQDIARFALMTFDQDQSAGTGVSAGAPYSVLPNPFDGMWSYFPNWGGGGAAAPASGNPVGCSSPSAFEVGARNSAAPPWEGRLVPFSASSDATIARETQNQQLRSVLSATRPYGGTPIAGIFSDAQTYLWTDPSGPGDPTNGDPYIASGCRKQFIILLTDGAPNQDLRPSCGSQNNPSAPCPYNMPETTAATLLTGGGGHQPVETFVVGFAVSSGTDQGGTLVKCSQLNPTGADCISPTATLAPCCELQKIAVAGQPPTNNPHAYFVDTAQDLSAALSDIFGSISGQTTRTLPAFSPVTSNIGYTTGSTTPNQSTYYASFDPGSPVPTTTTLASTAVPWTGDIDRKRYLCSSASLQGPTPALGDDFAQDLAQAATRHFITFVPPTPIDTTATIRPYAATAVADGIGNYGFSGGQQVSDTASGIISVLTPPALGLTSGANSCQYTSSLGTGAAYLSDTQCMTMLLDFTMGQTFSGGPADFPFVSRAGTLADGDALAFGGLYHATPTVVGPPGSLLHDDSYDLFRTSSMTTTPGFAPSGTAARDTIVYAATTDGLLHAFWADEPVLANNEEWALMPPAVMTQLLSGYPGANQFLLDGTPIVKDVIFDRQQGQTLSPSSTNPWRSTLVAGFGPSQLGYYAVDVTNPKYQQTAGIVTESSATDPSGPIFLWQLTKMPATNMPLFGHHGATPAITQVAINGSGGIHEVGVAILPGGWDSAAVAPAGSNVGCERDSHHRGLPDWSVTGGTFVYRKAVRCWGSTGNYADAVTGRSVSVVRLDTGEVLATFMRKYDATQYHPNDTLLKANPSRIIDTALDSPMTGTPAVYPTQTGADALKFFIGDMDGTVWRFDISNPDPSQWSGRLYYDLYNSTADTQASGNDWSNGQPIALPLVTSLDRQGRVVLNAASGSQDTFDLTGPNFLVSLTETVQTASGSTDFHAAVNWYLGSQLPSGPGVTPLPSSVWDVGERVSGPMVVFNNGLFFTTYSAGVTGNNVCTAGDARLWGMDYITPAPATTNTSGAGGNSPVGGLVLTGTHPYVDLGLTVGANVVVPGVSVQQTTACAQLTSGTDQYVPGATHATTSSYTGSSFALVAQAGKPSTSGGLGTGAQGVSIALPSPSAPTVVDSWAAVTE